MSCCDAHSELFYLKTLKPRLDAIDAQLELLIQAQERANREAQAKINALTDKLKGAETDLQAADSIPTP